MTRKNSFQARPGFSFFFFSVLGIIHVNEVFTKLLTLGICDRERQNGH